MGVKGFQLGCTKIVATIGPALTLDLDSDSKWSRENEEYIRVIHLFVELFAKGLSCIRFNFSHSNNEERECRLQLWKDAKKEFYEIFNRVREKDEKRPTFVFPFAELADTKGPEIRVWEMKNREKGQLYKRGESIQIFCREKKIGDERAFSVTDSTTRYNMAADCIIGERVLVDDGKLSLLIQGVNVDGGVVQVLVENDHYLKGNKRVNLPNADYSLPFLSEKDREDILFSVQNGFQFIALSFVNKVEDIMQVKKLISESGKEDRAWIISKIETAQCLKNIDSIISASDGIMVARGDLALESPYHVVPFWTKEILRKSARQRKPVIVATQMLDSLERNVVPTRAEVSDVYRAAELATDCTMLSGETAQGLFPVVALSTMSEILKSAERELNYVKLYSHFSREIESKRLLSLATFLFQDESKFSRIFACFLFADSLLEEEIDHLSNLKLPFPFVVFYKKKNYLEAEQDFKIKRSAVQRGLYKLSVLNSQDSSLEECVSEFLSCVDSFSLSSEFNYFFESDEYSRSSKNLRFVGMYEGGEFRLVQV